MTHHEKIHAKTVPTISRMTTNEVSILVHLHDEHHSLDFHLGHVK